MEIEINKPKIEDEELQRLFAEFPSKAAIKRAKYILNQYSKDSDVDIQCLAFSLDRADRRSKDWIKCADRLFVYAMEALSNSTSTALYEKVKEDVLEYNRLKNETTSV
jgi:hypothetical protein